MVTVDIQRCRTIELERLNSKSTCVTYVCHSRKQIHIIHMYYVTRLKILFSARARVKIFDKGREKR